MEKGLYRVHYIKETVRNGASYRILEFKVVNDTLENIKKKFHIYYLTDDVGNVIIDNRKRGN